MCNNDYAHLVPGTARHQVALCTDRRNHPGQFAIKGAMIKGVIPHGLLGRIWEAHHQLLDMRAAAAGRLKGSVCLALIDARRCRLDRRASIDEPASTSRLVGGGSLRR